MTQDHTISVHVMALPCIRYVIVDKLFNFFVHQIYLRQGAYNKGRKQFIRQLIRKLISTFFIFVILQTTVSNEEN